MAQDYHIYIHAENGGSGSNPTSTFTQRSQDSGVPEFATSAKQAIGYAASGVKGTAVSTGVSALSKAVPWVAVIIAIAKTADKVVSTGFAHQAEYTGHYENSTAYNNFKTIMGNVMNPVGFAKNLVHRNFQINKQNKEIAEQNKLLGGSVIKDFNVGV